MPPWAIPPPTPSPPPPPPSPPLPPAPPPPPPHTTLPPGLNRLPLSIDSTLLLLSEVAPPHSGVPPARWRAVVARSYDGSEWEYVRKPNAVVILGCDASGCDIVLPANTTMSYRLDERRGSAAHPTTSSSLPLDEAQLERIAARYLMRASFGPTNASIAALTSSLRTFVSGATAPATHRALVHDALRAHVREQMALPPTLHRAYYRQRTNPRLDHHHSHGALRSACTNGSRWHAYALTIHDVGSRVTITSRNGVALLMVNNLVRTELPNGWDGANFYPSPPPSPPPPPSPSPPPPSPSPPTTSSPSDTTTVSPPATSPPNAWQVCNVKESVGSSVYLGRVCPCGSNKPNLEAHQCSINAIIEPLRIRNPRITFSTTTQPADTLALAQSDATIEGLPAIAGDCANGTTLCASPSGGLLSGFRCIAPISSEECPVDTDLARCDLARVGELCNGGGECGTSSRLNNCRDRGGDDIYRVSAPVRSQVMILKALHAQCTLSPSAQTLDAFLYYNGVYYHHDVRLRTVRNTLDAPADLSSDVAHSRSECPNVAKNPFNAHTCVRHPSCAPLDFTSMTLTLNETTIRAFYETANQHVHVLRGLRIVTTNYENYMCSRTSRWINLGRVDAMVSANATTNASASGTAASSGGGTITHPSQCPTTQCCGVIFRGAPGAQCSPVPIWDFSDWVHPGPSHVLRGRLCGGVSYNWLGRSATHASMQDPEYINATALAYGAVKIGEHVDVACLGAPPPPPLMCTNTLDSATVASIVEAINTTDLNNEHVRDVRVQPNSRVPCTASRGAATVGVMVVVGDECWQHVHHDEYDVRDVSAYGMRYRGSTATSMPFMEAAIAGSSYLTWPSSMDRWSAEQRLLPYLGRFGDSVDFATLPDEVRTLAMADYFGVDAAAVDMRGSEACGSPGEVANDPSKDHRFEVTQQYNHFGTESLFRTYRTETGLVKSMVHAAVSLYAPDQLRQRVAWALSQIYIISETGQPAYLRKERTELWLQFYDIFVRHAFGNLRNVLREVSYAPIMGYYLTYLDSDSLAYSAAAPDECVI